MNFQNGMRPKPAGKEMKVRTMGSMRATNTVIGP